jgi:hypothetical protein
MAALPLITEGMLVSWCTERFIAENLLKNHTGELSEMVTAACGIGSLDGELKKYFVSTYVYSSFVLPFERYKKFLSTYGVNNYKVIACHAFITPMSRSQFESLFPSVRIDVWGVEGDKLASLIRNAFCHGGFAITQTAHVYLFNSEEGTLTPNFAVEFSIGDFFQFVDFCFSQFLKAIRRNHQQRT